jgi:nicotinamidase-related amidase
MEMQSGVVGPSAPLPQLADAVRAEGVIEHTSTLMSAGRAAGLPVVFCTVSYRADGRDRPGNAPMFAAMNRHPGHMIAGSDSAAIVEGLGHCGSDLVVSRAHGMSPFTGTALDATLRTLGIRTVVATGVSLNVGIFALAVEAVGLGYSVVIPRDCVAGVPAEYGQQVLNNSLAVLATLTESADLIALWQ